MQSDLERTRPSWHWRGALAAALACTVAAAQSNDLDALLLADTPTAFGRCQ